jgi:hypothetical protein
MKGNFPLTAMSGWLGVAVFATALIVPLGIKALRIGAPARGRFMTLHFFLGGAGPLIALTHAAIPMGAGGISARTDPGVIFATAALLLLLLQAGLGIALRGATEARPLLRAMHLATMSLIALLITAHVFINRA